MGDILIGTASWTDKSLLGSGWYPKGADSAEERLRFYASRFPLVEVDSTYYFPPSEKNSELWAERTPPDFTFNIKMFSLLTQHPTKTGGPLQGHGQARQETGLPEGPRAGRGRRGMGPVPQRAGAAASSREAWGAAGPVPTVVHDRRNGTGLHARGGQARGPYPHRGRVPQQDVDVARQPEGDPGASSRVTTSPTSRWTCRKASSARSRRSPR